MQDKAFIFDWSGTLSDNFHLFCNVCDKIFIDLGHHTISQDEIRQNFTLPYMKFWNKYLPNLSRKEQCVLYEKYIHQVGEPKLYKKVEEIILFLKKQGYKLFILSSDPISKLLPEVKKSSFFDLITEIIGDVYAKGDEIVTLIKKFNLDKKWTFYIGDTSGDIEAGQIAGVKTIGISWGFQHQDILKNAQPDFLINDIIEIKKIIM